MKKIIFASALALCTVIGFSSFKGHKTTSYWINVTTTGIPVGTALTASEVNFSTATTSDPLTCTQSKTYCVAEFDQSQLVFTGSNPTGFQSGTELPGVDSDLIGN